MRYIYSLCILAVLSTSACSSPKSLTASVLKFESFKYYFERFNADDIELYKQYIPNENVVSFLNGNIPLLDIPDSTIQKTYYFRWWTFRKHIKTTPKGFVITEFLPEVPWSGKYNTINCPAAYHIYEGRWLKEGKFVKDYINYWLKEADNSRKYSFWIADATLAYAKLHKDSLFIAETLPLLINNYTSWEAERRDAPGRLFWQEDNLDGMEYSAGGRVINNGIETGGTLAARPTINSYMYADAKAIARFSEFLNQGFNAQTFDKKALEIKHLVEQKLWNDSLQFFTQLPRHYTAQDRPASIRELIGYTPWYFNLPDDKPKYDSVWTKLLDSTAFAAPHGLTTTERSHPFFQIKYSGHECQWNGPSWPFATTQTLKSLSNYLNNYKSSKTITKQHYFDLLKQYASAHTITLENGKIQMWIDENINPFTGDWISRTRLKSWENGDWSNEKGGKERGKDYNHSGYVDLIINDLIGFKPQLDGNIVIEPLVPNSWDWFCLDNLTYQGKSMTILWDKTGERYRRGKGFKVIYDGNILHESINLSKITVSEKDFGK